MGRIRAFRPKRPAISAVTLQGQVFIAQLEPGLAAQLLERRHEIPGLAIAAPTGLRVVPARERVEHGVEVRRDMQPQVLEIVAGIDHHGQPVRAQVPI